MEVGELKTVLGADTAKLMFDYDWFKNLVMQNGRYEITSTRYDVPMISNWTGLVNNFTPANLRKRVASVAVYEDKTHLASNSYTHATHYSYDIHGNVKSIVQDNPQMGNNRYKLINYEYDLVSGKVNKVIYQPKGLVQNDADQFMHRYEYDADNRLTHVYTSDDGIIWEKDAKYFYYRHGPLARTEVGDLTVQGIDYAYTLQGWIKGINSNILNPLNDIGKDAMQNVANLHQNFANDLAAYSLKYYGEDYQPIAYNYPSQNPQITDANNFIANTNNITNLAAQSPDLYNGNISQMITTIMEASNSIKPQLTAYRYDQLNRIKQMKTFAGSSTNNAWSGVLSEKYAETYRYDANGNIVKLTRNDASGALFDDLMYGYKDINDNTIDYSSNNNLLTWELAHNKLETVIQNAGTASGEFVSSNYIYDNIGNLRSDDGEKITNIEWNIYGKISKIRKEATNDNIEIEFKYDAMGNRVAKIIKPAASLDNPQTWNYSFYTRDAQGNTMANYKMQYSAAAYHTTLTELDIYGSSRLGVKALGKLLDTPPDNPNLTYSRYLGYKHYEISNHLGNVITVFSDRKIAQDLDANGVIDSYKGVLLASNDYTPFGMQMANRGLNASIGAYRFGFNGMEKDNEVKGNGNQYTTLHRIYDPRIARWFSIDPEEDEFPDETPYNNNQNNPIANTDPNGDCPWCITAAIGGLVGAAVEFGSQVASNVATGKAWNDIDYADVATATVEGAVIGLTGGLGAAGKLSQTTIKVINTSTKIAAAVGQGAVDMKEKQFGGTSTVFGKKNLKDAVVETGINLVGTAIGGKSPTGTNKAKGPIPNVKTPKVAVKEARVKGPVNRMERLKIQEKANVKQKTIGVLNETIKGTGAGLFGNYVEYNLNKLTDDKKK